MNRKTRKQISKALLSAANALNSHKISAGYTQYFTVTRDLDNRERATILKGAKSIIKQAAADGIDIAGSRGSGRPELTKKYIALNGQKPEDYESFVLSFDESEFEFCKTNEKPYDAVVVSILAFAKKVAPDALDISSDGGDSVFRNPPYRP